MNVIDPRLHSSLAYVDTAQKLWENIKKRYSVPNVPRIHHLKAEIASCKQGNQELVEFFSKLMSLWNELGNYDKIPTCTWDAAEEMSKMLEQDKVHQFLMGLNEDVYGNIRSQILALDPLPSLNRIFSMVQQEENHRKRMVSDDNTHKGAAAFAVKFQGKQV